MSEHEIQAAIVKYIRNVRPGAMMTATLGGLQMHPRQMAKAKAAGYSNGIPDLLIFKTAYIKKNYDQSCIVEPFFGLALEIKTEKGKASDEQKIWIEALRNEGWYAHICYGLDECIARVNEYFGIK